MIPRYVIGLFVTAVAIGWMMPAMEPGPTQTESQEQALQSEALTAQDAGANAISDDFQDGDQIVLQRQADGHFYTGAEVDGAQLRFLVDTGASGIALTAADAEAMGISWDEDGLQKVGRGAGGDVYGKTILLKSIRVGQFEAHNVPAAVIPNGLDVSLLGQSFLATIGKLNIEQNQMTLG